MKHIDLYFENVVPYWEKYVNIKYAVNISSWKSYYVYNINYFEASWWI